jgi:hypothetical protein
MAQLTAAINDGTAFDANRKPDVTALYDSAGTAVTSMPRCEARAADRTGQPLNMAYDASTTAILLVDPYNDFLGEGGKLWPRVRAVAEEVRLLDHLREVISAARARRLKDLLRPA